MTDADSRPTPTGTYDVVGRGSDIAIDVAGPTAEACLTAAVAGLAAAVGEVRETASRRDEQITVVGEVPVNLLVDLVDELIVRLDADGELAVGLRGARIDDDGLHGALELVALADVSVRGGAPKAATWHGARLAPAGDGWTGHVMIDM